MIQKCSRQSGIKALANVERMHKPQIDRFEIKVRCPHLHTHPGRKRTHTALLASLFLTQQENSPFLFYTLLLFTTHYQTHTHTHTLFFFFPVRQVCCLCRLQPSGDGTLLDCTLLINQHLLMEEQMKEGGKERRRGGEWKGKRDGYK